MIRFALGAKWGRPATIDPSSLVEKRSGIRSEPSAMPPMPNPSPFRKRRRLKCKWRSSNSFSMSDILCSGLGNGLFQVIQDFDHPHQCGGGDWVYIGSLRIFADGQGLSGIDRILPETGKFLLIILGEGGEFRSGWSPAQDEAKCLYNLLIGG